MSSEKEYTDNAAARFGEVASGLLKTLSRFDDDRFNEAPSYGGWSPGQVGEHLFKAYGAADTMRGTVGAAGRPADKNIAEIKGIFLNFEIRLKSPEALLPGNDPKEQRHLLQVLGERISQIKGIIETEDLTLLCLDYEMPVLGRLTRLEWVYFCLFHTMRHIRQLENIMTDQQQFLRVSEKCS
jgi:hypothetical protein